MLVLDSDVSVVEVNPRLEGANIRTWIGFKHLLYMAEDAVLGWFRRRDYGPQRLFHQCGVSLDFASASVQLPSLVEIDDTIAAATDAVAPGRFSVRMRVQRRGDTQVVLAGRLGVKLVREPDVKASESLPGWLVPWLAPDVDADDAASRSRPCPGDPAATLSRGDAFYWPWQGRYFHCQYSRRLQHSAYVRALEEVVDRFLSARGLGIGHMLNNRALIPVVSRARVDVLTPAFMDETIHTTFTVCELLKSKAFDGQMDCFVRRDDALVHVATARILHGYAVSAGPDAGHLAVLDDGIVASLQGRPT